MLISFLYIMLPWQSDTSYLYLYTVNDGISLYTVKQKALFF